MAKKRKKSEKNNDKKATEAENLVEVVSKPAIVDDMESLGATAADDAAALKVETTTEAVVTPVNSVDLEDTSPLGDTYHHGPMTLHGQMIPSDDTTANLLKSGQDTDWLHIDPWRVLCTQLGFVDGFETLAELGPAVSIFDSARTQRTRSIHKAARRMGNQIAKHNITAITGGGLGVMEAANRRAALAGGRPVGLDIELPYEQGLNQWVNLGMGSRHFLMRRTTFIKYSSSMIVCPGGLDMLDEMFELLTLIQTHKVVNIPVVFHDKEYWQGLFDQLDGLVVEYDMISTIDPKLVTVADNADEAVDVVVSVIVRQVR